MDGSRVEDTWRSSGEDSRTGEAKGDGYFGKSSTGPGGLCQEISCGLPPRYAVYWHMMDMDGGGRVWS